MQKQSLTTSRLMPIQSPSNGCFGKTWRYMVWNISLVSGGQLSPLCPLPAPWPPPAYSLWGAEQEQRRPWRCTSTAQEQLKHCCVINTGLVADLQHSTVRAAVKKMNSLPAKPSTTVYTRQSAGFLIFFFKVISCHSLWFFYYSASF